MTRGLLLRELVNMYKQGILDARELARCISYLNRKCNPRFIYKMINLGTL